MFSLDTSTAVTALSVLTVIGQIIIAVLLISLLSEKIRKRHTRVLSFFTKNALLLMLIVAIAATLGSLYFSEIALWTPCKDCWIQRIFMYPQVILLGIALWKKDTKIAPYILALSVLGIIIAVDHYTEQVRANFFPVPNEEGVNMLLKPCDASGVSCAKTQIHFTFGYITIPLMACTAFVLNTIGSLLLLRSQKKLS